ncbi:unnamed protein product [Caenorhabditis bovis]|uniref:carnosine N-methyltransferase n=1 Tax=Caenorhabditis bovis TaxID=2654633 RepID=A0A8S1FEX4_9PELO|nr:unnamed protein product [Caenorhabditis bovis]
MEVANTENAEENSEIDEDVRATEKVINAFFYYKTYGKEKILKMVDQMRKIPPAHQLIIGPRYKEHIRNITQMMDHNHTVIRMIVNFGVTMFGEESLKAMRIHQARRPTADYMSKVLSTIRQICREWTEEGRPEREATFLPIIEELDKLFPREHCQRHLIRIMVPGCGLGRLACDLINEGYTVQGNEFSLFMLMTSNFMLNACKIENQFTIYPFIFEKSNTWSYEDQERAVTFPDKCPDQDVRRNSFSMCAGDFLEVTRNSTFDVIVTAWFIDTAHNILQYIETIYNTLEPNGIWVNVGPLTYHFEDSPDENSIELPYTEVIRFIREKGFEVITERRVESKYTVNRQSMLQNEFTCAFFTARKI